VKGGALFFFLLEDKDWGGADRGLGVDVSRALLHSEGRAFAKNDMIGRERWDASAVLGGCKRLGKRREDTPRFDLAKKSAHRTGGVSIRNDMF